MSQDKVFNFLKEHSPRVFTEKELILNLNIKEQSLCNNIRRLHKYNDVVKIKKNKKVYWGVTT